MRILATACLLVVLAGVAAAGDGPLWEVTVRRGQGLERTRLGAAAQRIPLAASPWSCTADVPLRSAGYFTRWVLCVGPGGVRISLQTWCGRGDVSGLGNGAAAMLYDGPAGADFTRLTLVCVLEN